VRPARVGNHPEGVAERGRDVVERMGRIAEAVDEHEARAGAAPVEILEPYAIDVRERRRGHDVLHRGRRVLFARSGGEC
jgi:hypothetical protein